MVRTCFIDGPRTVRANKEGTCRVLKLITTWVSVLSGETGQSYGYAPGNGNGSGGGGGGGGSDGP
jgi:hypothetical protein